MLLQPSFFNVTTGLLIAGACAVIVLLLRNIVDSNIPPVYFGLMILYADAVDGRLAPWLIYAGLVLALVLRFEFMNGPFTHAVRAMQLFVLSAVVYQCGAMILG